MRAPDKFPQQKAFPTRTAKQITAQADTINQLAFYNNTAQTQKNDRPEPELSMRTSPDKVTKITKTSPALSTDGGYNQKYAFKYNERHTYHHI